MQTLSTGESYTNHTTATQIALIEYYNLLGEKQVRTEKIEYLQTFTKTNPVTNVTIIF